MDQSGQPQQEFQLEYSQITDNIYLGSDLCDSKVCKLHGPEFEKLGVTVEISLTAELKDTPTDNVALYAWIPIIDDQAPTMDQLDFGSEIINAAMKQNRKVYIHCKLGHGRSPTMLAGYFIKYQKMSAKNALALIEEMRPEAHPTEVQMQALAEYEKLCSK